MLLNEHITQIEKLVSEDTQSSLSYAALECRLAIEFLCYEHLRLCHSYIAHADIKKWQPKDIVNILIQEVDGNAARDFTISIGKEPVNSEREPTIAEYESFEYIPLGTHVGFNPKLLGKLWNSLSHVALHVSVPISSDDHILHYGAKEEIMKKVKETLIELRRIDQSTLMSTGIGEVLSFTCDCGQENKRREGLLKNGQKVSCINKDCDESFSFNASDGTFERRSFTIKCGSCRNKIEIPTRHADQLRTNSIRTYNCSSCDNDIHVAWILSQSK